MGFDRIADRVRRRDRRRPGRRSAMIRRLVDGVDASDPRPLVVVFANHAYRAVLGNWLVAIGRLPEVRHLVVALDERLAAELSATGTPVAHVDGGRSLSSLWAVRVAVVRALVEAGIDVIHSDADAVWLRDPVAELLGVGSDADLVASQGTVFPRPVHHAWGFVLCCGLFAVRAGPAAASLLAEWDADVVRTGDDQRSLNRILLGHGVVWDVPDPFDIEFRDARIRCSDATITGTTETLRIELLPFRRFPRLAEHGTDPFVVHPLCPRGEGPPIDHLRELGLWMLDDGRSSG